MWLWCEKRKQSNFDLLMKGKAAHSMKNVKDP